MLLSRVKPSHDRVRVKPAVTEKKCFVFDFYSTHRSAICNLQFISGKNLTILTTIYIEHLFYEGTLGMK